MREELNTLLQKAVEESAASWRRKLTAASADFVREAAMQTVRQAYRSALDLARRMPVAPEESAEAEEGLADIDSESLQRIRRIGLEARRRMHEAALAAHREGLIQLFTMGEGAVPRPTAEAIVDLIITAEAGG